MLFTRWLNSLAGRIRSRRTRSVARRGAGRRGFWAPRADGRPLECGGSTPLWFRRGATGNLSSRDREGAVKFHDLRPLPHGPGSFFHKLGATFC